MDGTMNNSRPYRWIPISLLIGMAVGAALALLYAPKEGSETRRYIRDNAARVREQARETASRVRSNIPFGHHKGEEEVQEAVR